MSWHTAALCAWFWSPLSTGSGVFCRCVDPATGRARSKRQTVAPDGATGLFLAGGRRPPVRAQACGVMGRSRQEQCPTPPTGHHAAWVATGGEATGMQRPASTPSVTLRELRIIGRAVRSSSGAWIHQAPRPGWKPEGRRPVCGAPFTTARPAILPGRRHLHKMRPRNQTNRRLDGLCAACPNKNAAPR